MASESVGKTFMIWQTSNLCFYEVLEKSWIFFTHVLLLFVGRDVLWDALSPSLYILSLQTSKPLYTVEGFSLKRQAGESFNLKLAIVNGLWSKGRLPSQWSIRPTTGGFSSFRTRGLTYSPEGLEGHCNLMASCWPSSPTLLSSPWHAPQNCLVLLYGRILNYCFCPFSNIEQEISTVQSILGHLKVELWEAECLSIKSNKWGAGQKDTWLNLEPQTDSVKDMTWRVNSFHTKGRWREDYLETTCRGLVAWLLGWACR